MGYSGKTGRERWDSQSNRRWIVREKSARWIVTEIGTDRWDSLSKWKMG